MTDCKPRYVQDLFTLFCHGTGGNHRLLFTLYVAAKRASVWLLFPAALSLALFVWLLTLHPAASGRVYAAYGGVYVMTAMLWLYFVDGVKLSHTDWLGACVALAGMLIIVSGWKAG